MDGTKNRPTWFRRHDTLHGRGLLTAFTIARARHGRGPAFSRQTYALAGFMPDIQATGDPESRNVRFTDID